MADGTVTIDIKADGSQAESELDKVSSKAAEAGDAGSGFGEKMGGAFAKIGGAIAAAGVADKIKDITGQAISAASDLEQNIGGVQKLFGDSWRTVKADADAAYQTAGVSANDYMQQVTSFSASLISSLGGDTDAAADLANEAIVDMSDNANIFGSNIQDIQNAYQGFAKQNYTMLDNLKLGYGGTQSEMARLINDSGVLGDQITVTAETVNQVPFSKIIEAIHQIQAEQGIAGDTAEEAAQTFAGSYATMQAAAQNFLAALANPEGDNISETFQALMESVQTFAANAIPMLQAVGDQIIAIIPEIGAQAASAVTELAPQAGEAIGTLVAAIVALVITLAPSLIEAGVQLITGLITGVTQAMPQVTAAIVAAIPQLVDAFVSGIPQLMAAGILLFSALITAVAQVAPTIVQAIIGILPQFFGALISAAPQMGEAALQLFMAIAQAVPQILGAVSDGIDGIMQAACSLVAGAVGAMASAAATWFGGLVQGAQQKAGELVSFVQSIPGRIVGALGNLGGMLLNAGSQIMDGFFNGLKSSFGKVQSFVSGIGSWIVSHKGPPSVDRKLLVGNGQLIMQGLGEGLTRGFSRYVDGVIPDINGGLAGIGAIGGAGAATYSRNISIGEINISARDAIEAGSVEGIVSEALRKVPAWGGVI